MNKEFLPGHSSQETYKRFGKKIIPFIISWTELERRRCSLEISPGSQRKILSSITEIAVLSHFLSVFNPFGLYARFTMRLKMLLKSIWEKIQHWTDSVSALHWLYSAHRRQIVYVANKVAEILKLSPLMIRLSCADIDATSTRIR